MMPLVYTKAMERQSNIANNLTLRELEVSGFVKCIVRAACLDTQTKPERIKALKKSIEKQFSDLTLAPEGVAQLEALADLRNVSGLLFLELENKDE